MLCGNLVIRAASGPSQHCWSDLCGEGHMQPKTTVINIVTIPHDDLAVTASHTSQPHTPEVILGGKITRSRGSGLCSTNICPSLREEKQSLVSPKHTRGRARSLLPCLMTRWCSAHDSYSYMHMRHPLWSEKELRGVEGHAGLIEEAGNWSTCPLANQASSVISQPAHWFVTKINQSGVFPCFQEPCSCAWLVESCMSILVGVP